MRTVAHPSNDRFKFIEVHVIPEVPHLVVVSLDRPNKRNAINRSLWTEIGSVFSAVGGVNGCRCILLTGKGPAFCAGIDINDSGFFPVPGGDPAHTGIKFLPQLIEMQACFTALEKCPVPVVAAVHGKCIGAGIDLICAADIRICSSEAVFSVREVALGLAADVGTLQRLPKITGNTSLVNELCLTGRNFGTSEALSMGLVSSVSRNLYESALELCKKICEHSPVAVHGTKKALLFARDHTVADGLDQIATFNALALQSQDLPNAFAARAAKTTPQYQDLPPFSKL